MSSINDANYGASEYLAGFQVLQALTTLTLTSNVTTTTYGTYVFFTATLNPLSGSGLTGNVTFTDADGASINCMEAASTLKPNVVAVSNNVALCTCEGLGSGAHIITANYSGDVHFLSSTQTTVYNETRAVPYVQLESSVFSPVYGTGATITVRVARPAFGNVPTGTVVLYDGERTLQSLALTPTDAAAAFVYYTFTKELNAGAHSVRAVYQGQYTCTHACAKARALPQRTSEVESMQWISHVCFVE